MSSNALPANSHIICDDIGLSPIQSSSNQSSINSLLELYLQSLNEKELRAYMIAKSHLGSSFDLSKSGGFVKWQSRL